MKRHILITAFISVLLFSCTGTGVTVLYQGSSPIPMVQSNAESSQKQPDTHPEESFSLVIVYAIPSLEGGNRALQKRIIYPEEAIENDIEGIVSIQFTIDEEGNTTNFSTIQGIGYGCEEAVIKAIKQSKFNPGYDDPETTARFTWLVEVEFRL